MLSFRRTAIVCAVLFFACVGAQAQLTEPVGTTSPVQTATVTVTTAGTIGAINVLTQGTPNLDFNFVSGGSCTVGTAYAVNATCTVEYTFTPRAPGTRYGGITLTSGNTLLASAYVSGTGTGPQVNFPPGIQNQVASGFSHLWGLAFDGSGNLFVAAGNSGQITELFAATKYTTTKVISTGGVIVSGVAVDGTGNLFITESLSTQGGYSDVKEIFAAGGYTTIVTLNSNLNKAGGIAVDGNGNIFVGDYLNHTVQEILSAGGYSTVITLPGTYFNPEGVALDGSGNVFVADSGGYQITEILASSGYTTVQALPMIVYNATAVAVDVNDNVFAVIDAGSTIEEFFAASGYTTQSLILNLPSDASLGLALDGTGNVYFPEFVSGTVQKLDFSDPPTLSFATTPVGQTSTDSPQTVALTNSGNAPLTFSTPGTGINPSITAGFTLGNSSTCPELSSSAAPTTLAVGASCTDVVSFKPVAQGTPVTGSLTTTDNALNAVGATQVVPLGGTATAATTISTLTVSPNPAPVGTPVTLTATVTPNPASPNVPTGTVTFYGTTSIGTIGTAPLNNSGVAMLTTSALPAGTDSMNCAYSGDSNFATSNCAPVPEYVTVPQTITFTPPPSPQYAGTSVLLNASASSLLPVTFTVISGPATVSGYLLHYNGPGTVVVEADQAGNSIYSPAPPMQITISAALLTSPVGTTIANVLTYVSTNNSYSGLVYPGSIEFLTQGAPNLDFEDPPRACEISSGVYGNGSFCPVFFNFTPTHPGLRYGGIVIKDLTGNVIGTTDVYGVGIGPQVIYTPGTQSTLGSGFAYASGVAVDGSGNAYVSDLGNATVQGGLYEVPAGGGPQRSIGNFTGLGTGPDDVAVDGSGNVFVIYGVNRGSLAEVYAVSGVIPANPTVNVISTNLSGLNGMKVDGNGNVFLASSNPVSMIQEVLAVNGNIPANPSVVTLVSGIGQPTGVAIDQSGNVYFSDQTGNAYEIYAVNGVIPANPTVTALANNLNNPSNIVLDAANDVFVTESDAVIELVAVNGVVQPNTAQQVSIGTGLNYPEGMDVDASGNIYIADSGLPNAVKLDFSDAPSLTFATTQVGSTSTDSPQTVRFANGGNADLTFLPPASGTNPSITTGYTFTSTCPVLAAGTTVAYAIVAGASCAESISFTPVIAGPDPGALTLTDNNLNVVNAQQNILLNATGTIAPTTLTLIPSANPVYALQPLTFTVHLTTNGQGDAGQNVILTYTVGTLVVTASLTTDTTGSASYAVVGGLNPGSYAVSAAFAGTTSYQLSSAAITEVVNAIPTTSTLSVFPVQPVVNTNIVLTAVVTAQLSGPAPGTVTFFNGTTTLGTVALSSAGVAQYTIASLPIGNYSFGCAYNGATDYATSNCQTITDTVVPVPDFSLTATPPSITIETQHHKTMQLTLTGIGLFSGPVYLQCQGPLPPYLTCGLPQSETLGVGQTLNFNFAMDTDAVLDFLAANPPAEKTPWMNAPGKMALAMLLPLVLAGFARRRKTLQRLLLLAVLMIGATGLTACGDKWPGHTPPGTYVIPVVGTGTANGKTITHTLNITLTVTP